MLEQEESQTRQFMSSIRTTMFHTHGEEESSRGVACRQGHNFTLRFVLSNNTPVHDETRNGLRLQ